MISRKFILDYLNIARPGKESENSDMIPAFENFFNACIESSNMAIFVMDMNQNIVAVNSLTASVLGKSESNMIDTPIADILPGSPLTELTSQNLKSLPTRFELNGKKIYADRTFIYHDDTPYAMVSFFQDTTNFERTTERLNQAQQQEMFLSDIFENSYDGIYITDKEGKTIMVNNAYERIAGLDRSVLIGEYMTNLVSKGVVSTSLTAAVVAEKKTITRTQRNKNNKEVIITGNPVFDDNGNVRHVITNVRDITELFEANKKLEAAKGRADLYQEQLMLESSDENIVCGSREFKNVLNISAKVSKI